ncbi:MAG: NADH-quinone oxidoreductase subunit L [Alphaproteobacteria bacterium]
MTLTIKTISLLALYPPLVAFIIAGTINKRLPDLFAQAITCSFMGVACVAGFYLLNNIAIQGNPGSTYPLLLWMHVGDLSAYWGMRIDHLSVIMITTVNLISFLVHLYSIGYMSDDPHIPRFMSYLSLFTWTMLMLVSAPNLLQLFFGWEGVGLASYLLIGFWYERNSATAAGMKAFIVNRIGDMGLVLGIACLFAIFHTIDLDILFSKLAQIKASGQPIVGLNTAAALLLIGAMGKSAQLGLHVWLPDAMEGPTPVSALIHAATMVTAGVFLLVRMSPLYELTPMVCEIICIVGASTALFAASVACTQTDIKRIIAYSTCSQLGYMFLAVGCSAYAAATFHLVTHAFFKALLFLGAGSVIHAMSGEQDIRRMGGLYRRIPVTYAFMWIGSLAGAGLPFFPGFYSKHLILEAAFASTNPFALMAYCVGVFIVLLTALYSRRLILLVFHGHPRHTIVHIHEAPLLMQAPMWILALGATISGGVGIGYLVEPQHLPWIAKNMSVLTALFGIGLAYYLYWWRPAMVSILYDRYRAAYTFLFNKWYFDEIFERIFVQPILTFGTLFWYQGDRGIIDRFGPDGIAHSSMQAARVLGRLQTGYIYHYAFAMLLGLVLMLSWYVVSS